MKALERIALAPAVPAIAALDRIVQGMDYRSALETGRALGRVWFHGLRLRRSTVCEALGATFPRWSAARLARTAGRVFEHVAANAVTLLWATGDGIEPGDILANVRFEGFENWTAVRARGAIVATAHTGNWDLAAIATVASGIPLAVVSRSLAHPGFDALWNSRRARAGVALLGQSMRLGPILEAAGPGRALAVMIDQRTAASLGGIRLPFLGRPAWTSTLAAAAALRLGLPLLPVWSRSEQEGTLVIHVGRPLEPAPEERAMEAIRSLTLASTGDLESWILRHPDSWLWLHRRWTDRAH